MHLLLPRDEGVVSAMVAPVGPQWRAIGQHLGFTERELGSIASPHLKVLLGRWLKGPVPCTKDLIGALRTVGAEGVARQIELDGFLMSPWRVVYETAI